MPPRDSIGGSDDSKDQELDWDWIGQLESENFTNEEMVNAEFTQIFQVEKGFLHKLQSQFEGIITSWKPQDAIEQVKCRLNRCCLRRKP